MRFITQDNKPLTYLKAAPLRVINLSKSIGCVLWEGTTWRAAFWRGSAAPGGLRSAATGSSSCGVVHGDVGKGGPWPRHP